MVERSTASEGFQLDHAACIALLATQQVGRLVIADAGPPQIALVNYVLSGEVIVLRSDGGAKPHPLGQAVVFEVDCVDDRTHSAWSVIVRGTATEADPSRWSDLSLEPRAPGPEGALVRGCHRGRHRPPAAGTPGTGRRPFRLPVTSTGRTHVVTSSTAAPVNRSWARSRSASSA